MKNKFPLSFYFKLCFITLVLLFTYFQHSSFIQTTIADDSLDFQESFTSIMKEVMGLPSRNQNLTQNTDYISEYAEPGNSTPYDIQDEVLYSDNYKKAQAEADEFNQALDIYALNDAFVRKVNFMRSSMGWEAISVGYHLEEGVEQRVSELAENQYLSSLTSDGQDFRSHFANISDPQYRLGENLYELYISAGDIHLSTWQNPKILADYLYDAFDDALSNANYDVYQSQYISIRAEATDYNIDEAPYVRLVVSLVSDTMEG